MVKSVLVFLCAFLCTALLLTAWARHNNTTQEPIALLAQKRADLEALAGTVDTLLIGSSQIYRGIDPVHLDREMAKRGCRSTSYNLGIPSLNIVEMHGMASKLNAAAFQGVTRVLLEMPPPTTIDVRNWLTVRTRHFMSAGNLSVILQDIWSSSDSWLRKSKQTVSTFIAFAVEWSSVGHLASTWFPNLVPTADASPARVQGYLALEADPDPGIAARGQYFQTHFATYSARFAALLQDPPPPSDLSATRWQLLKDLGQAFSGIGKEHYFIVMPRPDAARVAEGQAMQAAWTAEGPDMALLNFNLPQQYPELFDPAHWFDGGHLALSGVRRLTSLLAERLCR